MGVDAVVVVADLGDLGLGRLEDGGFLAAVDLVNVGRLVRAGRWGDGEDGVGWDTSC